jgi:hypothetical protein
MQLVEAPNLIRYGGRFILLYSVGDYLLDNYKLGAAYSDRLIPPDGARYQKVFRKDEQEVWGRQDSPMEVVYVLQSQKKDWPNYGADLVVGPGVGSVIFLGGSPWLLFHGYRPAGTKRKPEDRYDFKFPLRIDIRGGRPTPDWLTIEWPAGRTGRRGENGDVFPCHSRGRSSK